MKKLFLIILVAGFAFAGCGNKNETVKKEVVIPVEVAIVKKGQLNNIFQFVGNIEGKDQVKIYSKVAGKLIEYKIKEGGEVKKKDIVALIDRDITGSKFEPAPVQSPISGIVVKTYLDQGDSLNPQMPVAVIANMDEAKIKIEIPEVDYPFVRLGQKAEISIDAYANKKFVGKISKLSVLIDPNTRTATAEISIKNNKHMLIPGMYARVKLFAGGHSGLVVPRDAILRLPGTGVYYCFLVDGNKAEKVIVQLGAAEKNLQEIKQGLKKGDLVILSGQGILKTGIKVEIKKRI